MAAFRPDVVWVTLGKLQFEESIDAFFDCDAISLGFVAEQQSMAHHRMNQGSYIFERYM